jgi:hypothetical protein
MNLGPDVDLEDCARSLTYETWRIIKLLFP